eukprot:scaffold288604_cov46-Prasinocladus_malaysianus.AAC.1
MKKKCKSRYPMHKIYQLSPKFIDREVKAINALRLELQKLGLGGQLGNWKQLTSGGHAVLLFSKVESSHFLLKPPEFKARVEVAALSSLTP